MQQSKENYQKSRYYSYEVYKPGNTAAQRSKNLEKAQSYYEKAQKQNHQYTTPQPTSRKLLSSTTHNKDMPYKTIITLFKLPSLRTLNIPPKKKKYPQA